MRAERWYQIQFSQHIHGVLPYFTLEFLVLEREYFLEASY